MATSKPKKSVKQPLNPDFVYDFPAMVFPTEFDPNATPSAAAQSAAQVPATTPAVTGAVAKKKSTKSANIQDQLELEPLKRQNLQLELKLLSQKEKSAQKHSKQHKTKCQLMHVVNLCTTGRKKKSLRRS